jgi:fermentation-respiration switch protein FrsA (DUF1100 family)
LALFAILTTALIFGGSLPIGVAYLYVQVLLGGPCANRGQPLPDHFHEPARLESILLSPDSEPGLVIEGWYAPGSNGRAIIVLPGAYGERDTMHHEANFLHQAGYSILTYETRSCADPPRITTLGYAETAELRAAVDFLQARPELDGAPIGVFGFSQGGVTAILGAAQDERIAAVVAVGNYADLKQDIREGIRWQDDPLAWWSLMWVETFYEWRTGIEAEEVSPLKAIAQIAPRPVFLIHGSLEEEDSDGRAQYAAAQDPKAFLLIEGADHGDYMRVAPDQYRQASLDFLQEALSHDTPPP